MSSSEPTTTPAFLMGGGEMGALIRAHDWSKTAIGPIAGWCPALRMQVSFLLANRFPMLLWWGPTFCSIYNDAYAPILGAKHPWALGRPVSECWSEIWDVLRPLIETPFQGGPPTWIEDFQVEIHRHGYLEEGHFTVAYSPVPDETAPRGIGGVVATVHEISGTVIAERRVAALRDLGSRASEGKTAEQACAIAGATLSAYGKDLPFVLLYLIDAAGEHATLAGTAGVAMGDDISPLRVSLRESSTHGWPLAGASRSDAAIVVEGLAPRFSAVPPGPWSDSPHTGIVMAIPSNKAGEPAGLLVAGVSPRHRLDPHYRDFFALLCTQLATAIANARAYEVEKKRAEALAEIDRAKTAFFSNVSHEFRTPLTLMLGPVEELLSRSFNELSPAAKAQLDIVHRNGQRLLRLVNTLLDFSRIEAGRVRAQYQATDLAAFTGELASVFRSAIERAGMTLAVDCPPLTEPVFVDRDMWEKVVLNLLSNAFKFTFEGEISLSLRQSETSAEVRVTDTGTGIPEQEMPRLFERFHRVENARGRTHEGSGIGLALVHELVKIHGGSITATSIVGRGTTFTIALPLGTAHLPEDQIVESRSMAGANTGPNPYVDEALHWLPEAAQAVPSSFPEPLHSDRLAVPAPRSTEESNDERPRVLVVDDNSDMRSYVTRLLTEQYRVVAAPDGEAALVEARERRPDLVLTDVMMPRLDGLGLLRELRADPALRDIPVIMLSARAGEEHRVEGMSSGADDYLVKPFSARELQARVGAHLEMARMRRAAEASLRESEARFRHMADNAPVMVWITELDGSCSYLSKSWYEVTGQTPETGLGFGWLDVVHPEDRSRTKASFLAASEHHEAVELEYRLRRHDGEYRWVIDIASPRFAAEGAMLGYIGSVIDITERQQAEAQRREQERLKDDFLATLSHELRNPLNAVLGWAQFLKKDADYPDRVLSAAEVIDRNARIQLRLISDLLDLSRISAGKLTLDLRPVELPGVIDAAVQSMRPTADEREVSLVTVIEPGTRAIQGDPARLQQIVWNLLSNAVKFTPRGGEVRVVLSTSGSFAELRVVDTGQGIAAEFLPHLFQRFRQADASASRRHGGLGIGLSLVKQLVELHRGRVRAESDGPGTGSSFVVELPLSRARAGDVAARPESLQVTDLNGLHALVVDDELDALVMVRRILEESHAVVDVAHSTDEALKTLENEEFDLVISDIGMPGRDGYELAREMRARGMLTPAVALTAFARSEDRAAAFRSGYQAHVAKPVNAAELVATIAALDARSVRDPAPVRGRRNPPS